jgi:transposase-like protein
VIEAHSHPNGRRRGFSKAELAEIVRLYRVECWSMDRIGVRYGCSNGAILYWLRKLGVKTRPQGRTGFKVTPRHRAQAAKKGALSQATIAAQEFSQPSLVRLPRHLQERFDAIMADVRAERGSPWGLANIKGVGR